MTDRQTNRRTDRQTDRQTNRAWVSAWTKPKSSTCVVQIVVEWKRNINNGGWALGTIYNLTTKMYNFHVNWDLAVGLWLDVPWATNWRSIDEMSPYSQWHLTQTDDSALKFIYTFEYKRIRLIWSGDFIVKNLKRPGQSAVKM